MRLTVRLHSELRDVSIRRWNKVWDCRGKFYDYPAAIPDALKEKGIEVVDVANIEPELPRWTPPVPDDPRFKEPLTLEERADWKEEPAYIFNTRARLFEGVKQACLIAKAQHIEGLPPAVERLVGAVDVPQRDTLLQRYIMQSQVWNPTKDKLNKRYDTRKPGWSFRREYGIRPSHSSSILLRNLLRLCLSESHRLDNNTPSRKHIADSLLHSHIYYKGKAVVAHQPVPFMVVSESPLEPFGDESAVDASVGHVIPDMWPVYPTVDFVQSNNYELENVAGFKPESNSRLHPHTLLDICTTGFWDDSHIQGNQIMSCLMTAAVMARNKFGDNIGHLPEPISIQQITLRETRLLFTYFQLNTLDLDSDKGVKNLVWTGPADNLCVKELGQPYMPKPMKKNRLLDFDGSVFDTFLATYLNGTTTSV